MQVELSAALSATARQNDAEQGQDDFKGVDLKCKIAVFLINDPDYEALPSEPVAGKFGGKAATYYGRWMYKFEEAARRGALGAIIVHETAGAAYPWSTVVASNGDSYDVVLDDPAKAHPLLQGWIQRDLAVELFKQSGLDFEAEKVRARTAGFKPVELKGAAFSADFAIALNRLTSHNVLAQIPGAARPNESVMFAAHWDAFGQGPPDATGDTVRHGAADDGIGVAGVLEIARAFAKGPKPQRTVAFGVWTAEERGLLGSEYYAANQPKFLATTAGELLPWTWSRPPAPATTWCWWAPARTLEVGEGMPCGRRQAVRMITASTRIRRRRCSPSRRPLQRRQARRADRADHGDGRRAGPGGRGA